MKEFNTLGQLVRETNEPPMPKPKNTEATVLKTCNINNEPKKPGDKVLVCEDTYRNLVKKGVLGPKDAKLPASNNGK